MIDHARSSCLITLTTEPFLTHVPLSYPHFNNTPIRSHPLDRRQATLLQSHRYYCAFTMLRLTFIIIYYISIIALTMTQSIGPIVDQNEQVKGRNRIAVVSLVVQNRGMNRGESGYQRMRELFLHSLRTTG